MPVPLNTNQVIVKVTQSESKLSTKVLVLSVTSQATWLRRDSWCELHFGWNL